jgi:hypothetical protein
VRGILQGTICPCGSSILFSECLPRPAARMDFFFSLINGSFTGYNAREGYKRTESPFQLSNVIGIHWHLFDPSTTTHTHTHTLTCCIVHCGTSVSSVSSVKSVKSVSQSRYPSHYVGPRVAIYLLIGFMYYSHFTSPLNYLFIYLLLVHFCFFRGNSFISFHFEYRCR